jgi:hypothetical protein
MAYAKIGSLLHQAPNRAYTRTGNFTEDGKPLWTSREWQRGEKEQYLASIQPQEWTDLGEPDDNEA